MTNPPLETTFLAGEIPNAPLDTAGFAVLPIPYEKTVSYGAGTARGPQAILEASTQLETWDGRSNPSTMGIHTCPMVDCEGPAEAVLERVAQATRAILDTDALPVALGGEHTISWGVLQGFSGSGRGDVKEAEDGDIWNALPRPTKDIYSLLRKPQSTDKTSLPLILFG